MKNVLSIASTLILGSMLALSACGTKKPAAEPAKTDPAATDPAKDPAKPDPAAAAPKPDDKTGTVKTTH